MIGPRQERLRKVVCAGPLHRMMKIKAGDPVDDVDLFTFPGWDETPQGVGFWGGYSDGRLADMEFVEAVAWIAELVGVQEEAL